MKKYNPWENNLDPRILGLGINNQFSPLNSPSRGMLEHNQTKTSIVIKNPDKPRLISGSGVEMLKGNMGVLLPKDSKVLKFIDYSINGKTIETTVIYYNGKSGEIDREIIKSYDKNNKWFGFEHKQSEAYKNLKVGDTVKEDAFLTITNSNVDGEEAIGLELNVAWIPHPGTDEDGMLVSKSTIDRFEFNLYDTKTLKYTKDDIPINQHGDDDNYKVIPDVGETVKPDGILFATRKLTDETYLQKFSLRALQEVDEEADKVYRVKNSTSKDDTIRIKEVEVVDVRVYFAGDKNLSKINKGLKHTYTQIEKYHNAMIKYLTNMTDAVDELMELYPDVRIANQLHVDYVNAKMYMNPKAKKSWNRESIDIWKVDITVKYTVKPDVKSKITTRHGHKGIIVGVIDDELMPVDENGLRADVAINPLGIPNRMNLGNPYEGYLTANSKVVSNKVKEMIDKNTPINEIDDYVIGYLKLFNEESALAYEMADEIERLEYAKDIRPLLTLANNKIPYFVAMDIMNSKYAMKVNKFWIYDDDGNKKLVKSPIGMQSNYMLLLYKMGESWLAANATYINKLGIPVSASKNTKERVPYNAGPVKESIAEGRMRPAFMNREAMVEFRDRSVNPHSQRLIIRRILEEDEPMKIDRIIDRDKHKFGGDIVLQALKSLSETFGEQFIHVKEEDYQDEDKNM